MKITSLQNPKIKNLMQLRKAKNRREQDVIIVDGVREIAKALKSGVTCEEIYLCPPLMNEQEKINWGQTPIFEVTESLFAKIAFGDRLEGALALCRPVRRQLSELKGKSNPVFVIVESVEKPGNLGAILRTCDGAGVDGVIVCSPTTDIFNPNVIRASLGTIFTQKVVVASNEDALRFCQSDTISIVAATPSAKKLYTDVDLKKSCAIVVGSEDEGLSDFWLKNATVPVRLPMLGVVDSLNVSACTAVLLYEAVRQRALLS